MSTTSPIEVIASAGRALSPTARHILHTIHGKAQARGVPELDAYKTDIAEWTGYDLRTIARVVPQLVADGWLVTREQRAPRPTLYRLGPRFDGEAGCPPATSGGGPVSAPAPGGTVLPFQRPKAPPPPDVDTAPLLTRTGAACVPKCTLEPERSSQLALGCADVPAASPAQLVGSAVAGYRAARQEVHGYPHVEGGPRVPDAAAVLVQLASETLEARGFEVTADAVEELSRLGCAHLMRENRGERAVKAKHPIVWLLRDDGPDAVLIRDGMALAFAPAKSERAPAVAPAERLPLDQLEERTAKAQRARAAAGDGVPSFQLPPRRRAGGE